MIMHFSGFIVTGGGRTGSHWLEQVVNFVTEIETKDINDISLDQPFLAHNHSISNLLAVPAAIRESCLLIMTKRSNLFSQAVSTAVARHTDEWFVYSDRTPQPFRIDPTHFRSILHDISYWNYMFDQQVRPCYQSVIEVAFETMVAQDPIEDWVAEKIGVPNTAGYKSWVHNRNPRNYAHLIENYQQLIDRFGKWALT